MRLKGLIKVFNQVRSRLQVGLTADEVEPFKQQVLSVLLTVEELCRNDGRTPDDLPAPSRMAYKFLKGLDLNNLPLSDAHSTPVRAHALRIGNLVKIGDYFAGSLWNRLDLYHSSADAHARLRQEIAGHVSDVERICVRHETTPALLEARSKQVYCWLKFLSIDDNFGLHLEALRRARCALAEHQSQLVLPVHVHLVGVNVIWRKKPFSNAVLLKVSEGFLNADASIWQAIVRTAALGGDPAEALLIQEFSESEDFTEVIFEMDAYASAHELTTRGRVYDLEETFARVNATYFGRSMPKPKLSWNRTLTARKFGHYQPSRDMVMISVSLDDPEIPSYLLDFVLYHELLHKKHGAAIVNGRRQSHGPIFRADERRFAEYREAMQRLNELALRQRGLIPADDEAGIA
jgi:hypothetical protein